MDKYDVPMLAKLLQDALDKVEGDYSCLYDIRVALRDYIGLTPGSEMDLICYGFLLGAEHASTLLGAWDKYDNLIGK